MKVAIIDDEKEEIANLIACLNYVSKKQGIEFDISSFTNGNEFIFGFKPIYDLIFLDIEMPNVDGLSLAKQIREIDYCVNLVFVTKLANLAIKGYEVFASGFMVKPINPKTFELKMSRILQLKKTYVKRKIVIDDSDRQVCVDFDDIYFIEIQGHYCVYHLKSCEYKEYINLSAVTKKLSDSAFVYVNRSSLVNLRYLKSFTSDNVDIGICKLPVARTRRKKLIEEISEYMRGD